MMDESEINEDLLHEIEREYDQQRKRLEDAREAFKKKQKESLQKRAIELRKQIETLNNESLRHREERLALRKKLSSKKKTKDAQIQENLEFEQQVWYLEREHQLEEAARKKLKLERIREERLGKERLVDKYLVQIDEIEEEKHRRDQSDEERLNALLRKAEHLKETLANNPNQDLTELKGIFHENSSEEIPYRLVDELEPHRQRNFEQVKFKRMEVLQDLNARRLTLMKEEGALRAKRINYEGLVSNGNEFLVDLELGKIEAQVKDIENNEISDDMDEIAIDDVLKEANSYLSKEKTIRKELQAELELIETKEKDWGVLKEEEYDGCLGPSSYTSSQRRAYQLSRDIVLSVVPIVVDISRNSRRIENLVNEEIQWKASEKSLEMHEKERKRRLATLDIQNEIMSECVRAQIKYIWKEVCFTTKKVNTVIFEAIKRVVQVGDDITSNQRTLFRSAYKEIRVERAEMDAWILRTDLPDDEITSRLRYFEHDVVSADEIVLEEQPKRKSKKSIAENSDNLESQTTELDAIHEDAVMRRPPKDPKRDEIAGISGEMKSTDADDEGRWKQQERFERDYWKDVSYEVKEVVPFFSSKKGPPSVGITQVAFSPNGRYLAGSNTTGTLFVWSVTCMNEIPLSSKDKQKEKCESKFSFALLRQSAPTKDNVSTPVLWIQWSPDNTSLLMLDNNKTLRVWSVLPRKPTGNTYNASGGAPFKCSSGFMDESSPTTSPLSLLKELSINDFLTEEEEEQRRKTLKSAKKKIDTEKQLEHISTACFFPSVSMVGKSNSILVGTTNGRIMKYSLQALQHNPTLSFTYGSNLTDRIVETFHGHFHEIAHLGIFQYPAGSAPLMHRNKNLSSSIQFVSVDKECIVCTWCYDATFLTGYQWFKYHRKYQMDFGIVSNPKEKIMRVLSSKSCPSDLFFMMYYPTPPSTNPLPSESKSKRKSEQNSSNTGPQSFVKLYQFRLSDQSIFPVNITIPTKKPSQLLLSPMWTGLRTDVAHVINEDSIQFFSLNTGQRLEPSFPIPANAQPHHSCYSIHGGGSFFSSLLNVILTGPNAKSMCMLQVRNSGKAETESKLKKNELPVAAMKRVEDTITDLVVSRETEKLSDKELRGYIRFLLFRLGDCATALTDRERKDFMLKNGRS